MSCNNFSKVGSTSECLASDPTLEKREVSFNEEFLMSREVFDFHELSHERNESLEAIATQHEFGHGKLFDLSLVFLSLNLTRVTLEPFVCLQVVEFVVLRS